MCGIAGILHFDRVGDASVRTRAMADAVLHRGPDGAGYWSDSDVSLGFRRLAIVDLQTGNQPMSNEDGTVWVVFNGEIYNHVGLRRELESRGHVFHSDHSDTEVLVHGYEEWGERLPERLNGMFAFAVWDQRRRTMFLARDRYGIKPLYTCMLANGVLLFGSEIRALGASGLLSLQAEPSRVLEYFSLMNLWHGRTPFAGVNLLCQGTSLTVTPDGCKERKYWDFRFERRGNRNLKDQADRLRSALSDAMTRQMAADVPVMTYLSGGIDSSAITAAAHQIDKNVKSYSCIFDLTNVGDDRIVDEREFSRSVAEHLQIDRVELTIHQDALEQAIDRTIAALEYPRMGMAYVNYLIAQRVAADAKVVLSGTGGDEISGGYVSRYSIVPRGGRDLTSLWSRLVHYMRAKSEGGAADAFHVYRQALNVPIAWDQLSSAFTPEFLRQAGPFDARDEIERVLSQSPSSDPWDKVMYADATTYLHGLLVLEDKLSMTHSLESRVPLLDNEVVDVLLETPWSMLADGKTGKIVFREAVRPWVPDIVADKPKMGFGPPDASWYRGPLRPWIEQMLSPRAIEARGVFRQSYVAAKLEDHFSGKANNVALIWCLLSFETWCRQSGVFGGRHSAAA